MYNTNIFEVCENLRQDQEFIQTFTEVAAETAFVILDKELSKRILDLSPSSITAELEKVCQKGDCNGVKLFVNIAEESLERFANLGKEVA